MNIYRQVYQFPPQIPREISRESQKNTPKIRGGNIAGVFLSSCFVPICKAFTRKSLIFALSEREVPEITGFNPVVFVPISHKSGDL